ncbi:MULTISPECIES: rcc01693 family protein [unclassified Aureimonas]|uniref:rcc01693 family protein n=1 Tax=unclassified Aureimonas TaxID=2615206 RepID=UPI0006FA07B5|nr:MULTISPECIES: rcc01693 family protein [unclassified Aureimonas]KQT55271.1 hypothetical protein ASG62_10600 [Aureimonas sp. Leaf427]KQT71063.1 hypothetical protein ASG54_20985 [Aureimonas sp. Leaf460]
MSAAPGPVPDPGAAGFPFDEAMTAGFALIGLSSAEFWAMTPREFARALAPFASRCCEPMGRADLAALMARFPDDEAR